MAYILSYAVAKMVWSPPPKEEELNKIVKEVRSVKKRRAILISILAMTTIILYTYYPIDLEIPKTLCSYNSTWNIHIHRMAIHDSI